MANAYFTLQFYMKQAIIYPSAEQPGADDVGRKVVKVLVDVGTAIVADGETGDDQGLNGTNYLIAHDTHPGWS